MHEEVRLGSKQADDRIDQPVDGWAQREAHDVDLPAAQLGVTTYAVPAVTVALGFLAFGEIPPTLAIAAAAFAGADASGGCCSWNFRICCAS